MKEVKDFIHQMSEKHKVPVDRIVIYLIGADLYVTDYNSGRAFGNEFKVLEIIEP